MILLFSGFMNDRYCSRKPPPRFSKQFLSYPMQFNALILNIKIFFAITAWLWRYSTWKLQFYTVFIRIKVPYILYNVDIFCIIIRRKVFHTDTI